MPRANKTGHVWTPTRRISSTPVLRLSRTVWFTAESIRPSRGFNGRNSFDVSGLSVWNFTMGSRWSRTGHFTNAGHFAKSSPPPFVRVIEYEAFAGCSGLTTVIFNDGLEEIGMGAFSGCALVRIKIPSSIRVIEFEAFTGWSGLTTAILNDGLEEIEIEGRAFRGCTLVKINIPTSVREIDVAAFEDCSNLTTVRFCNEIEEFVSSGSIRDWWNHGVHEKCLSTYCLLVRGMVHAWVAQKLLKRDILRDLRCPIYKYLRWLLVNDT